MSTNLTSEVINGKRWVECSCGVGEYLPKQLRHRRACRTQAQWTDAAVERVVVDLTAFAANVKRTALSKGRTEDLVKAVRTGRLSVSAAMNTDD